MIEEEQDLVRSQVNSEDPCVNLSGCRGCVAYSSETNALAFFCSLLNFRFRILQVDLFDEGEVFHGPTSEVAVELAGNTGQATAQELLVLQKREAHGGSCPESRNS